MTVQPASTEIASRTAAVIEELKGLEGPLLPILHGIQEEFGHVPAGDAADHRRGAEHFARRGAWRRHLLPRLTAAIRPAGMC